MRLRNIFYINFAVQVFVHHDDFALLLAKKWVEKHIRYKIYKLLNNTKVKYKIGLQCN